MDETERQIRRALQRRPSSKVYSVPRRYDLATLFAVSVAYAFLFGGMRFFAWPPVVFALVAGFFTCVGLGQALLFGGKEPRAASVLVGVFYGPIVLVISAVGWGGASNIGKLSVGAICTAIGGGLYGYLAGVIVAGVFLVADLMRKLAGRLTDRRAQRKAPPN